MGAILEAQGLVKSYDGRRVVDALSLSCAEGEVLGLLGPNGAGKTTTLRMLYGFVEPEAGSIRIRGEDFEARRTELKRLIGVCTQEDTLDYDFSVKQNLEVYASYFRPRVEKLDARIEELLEAFGLDRYRDHSPHALSGGFKRRLLIARSVVHRPKLLFLDEPTTGLDPRARVEVWELVDRLRDAGMAIILTTHYMDEAEKLSDRLVVLARGASVASGTANDVLGALLGDHVLVIPPETEEREAMVEFLRTSLEVTPYDVLRELRAPVSTEGLARFSERFGDARFDIRRPNLDDLFLSLSLDPESVSEETAR